MAKDIKYIKVALSHSTHSFIALRYIQRVIQLILLFLTSLGSWSWPLTFPLQPTIPNTASFNLHSNRAYLIENLKPDHKYYVLEHWQELETRVIHYYIKFYLNLGLTSS
jgi:hypothetical protein